MGLIKDMEQYAQENNVPIVQEEGFQLIKDLIVENKIKDILELGSAIGYSAIRMAQISEDISIVTIERDDCRYQEALLNIDKAKLCDRIKICHMDAYDYKTDNQFDLIFLDAAKAQYKGMMELFLPNLKVNGLIIVDNLMFHGFVTRYPDIGNRNTRQLVGKIIKFREYLSTREDLDVEFYDEVGDGLAIIRKRG